MHEFRSQKNDFVACASTKPRLRGRASTIITTRATTSEILDESFVCATKRDTIFLTCSITPSSSILIDKNQLWIDQIDNTQQGTLTPCISASNNMVRGVGPLDALRASTSLGMIISQAQDR